MTLHRQIFVNAIIISCLSALTIYSASQEDINRFFTSQRSFYSAEVSAFAGAGSAIPSGINDGLLNPALVYSYENEMQKGHGSFSIGYGRDSIFGQHVVPIGISYAAGGQAVGLFYRYLQGRDGQTDNEVTLNLSGGLFKQVDQQGPVNFGINMRADRIVWPLHYQPQLPIMQWSVDTALTHTTAASKQVGLSDSLNGEIYENQLLFDIGFFQKEISPHLDFALVCKNVLGYRWTHESPTVQNDIIYKDTVKDTIHIRDSSYYTPDYHTTLDWISSAYRTVVIGLSYKVSFPASQIELLFPLDAELFGLFEKGMKQTVSFQCGMQLKLRENYLIRIGYAHAPGYIPTKFTNIKNTDLVTAGARMSIAPVNLDLFVNKDGWGVTTAVDY